VIREATANRAAGWPALEGAVPGELRCHRGVWGKAHGARSDFRWLARSRGLGHHRPGFGRSLNLGPEDWPERFLCWRALDADGDGSEGDGASYCAVAVYPSRAADAAGRRGFVEKQLLEWRPAADEPAVAGAFALLDRAATLDDAVWWPRRDGGAWADPDFALAIDEGESRPLPWSPEELASRVDAGLGELRRSGAGEEALAELYAGLLSGRRPALLRGCERPLPAPALAALLLPLPRELADRLSLAGWLPSGRADLEELGRRWRVIVVPPHLRLPAGPEGVDAAAREEGRRMAEALLAADPGLLEPRAAADPWEEWTAALRHDLEGATERLIDAGAWVEWRRHARLQPQERLNVAMAWLTAPCWHRPGAPAPDPQSWQEALDDVGTLTRPRLKRLAAGGRRRWPWISGREAEQLGELAAMVHDPADAELLVRAVEPELADRLGATLRELRPAAVAGGAEPRHPREEEP